MIPGRNETLRINGRARLLRDAPFFDDLIVKGHRPVLVLLVEIDQTTDNKVRWKLVWEFLEEYRWEPAHAQPPLLQDQPSPVGDDRWDALLAALAEHLAAQHDLAPAGWTESRVLARPYVGNAT